MNNIYLVAAVTGLLIAQAAIDIKTRRLPDRLNLLILVAGIITMDSPADELAGMLIVPIFMLLTNVIVPGAFGGGDIKLTAAVGLFCGYKITVTGALMGITASGMYGLMLLITGKKNLKDYFALGPFLVAGFMIMIFHERNEVFYNMQPYQIVGIVLIAVGVILFAYYFHDKKKRKDEDSVERLRPKSGK